MIERAEHLQWTNELQIISLSVCVGVTCAPAVQEPDMSL